MPTAKPRLQIKMTGGNRQKARERAYRNWERNKEARIAEITRACDAAREAHYEDCRRRGVPILWELKKDANGNWVRKED
jgi:hypothetical protein